MTSDFVAYHNNGVIVMIDDSWIMVSDAERKRMNKLIMSIINDKSKHKKRKE